MHAHTSTNRSVGRWPVALAIVLSGTFAVGRAAPQAPQPAPASPTAPPAPAAPAEKRVKFEFNGKPWKQVIEWLADQSGLQFVGINLPTGSCNIVIPKGSIGATQGFTIPEVIDIINEAMLANPPTQQWQLIRREMSFTLVPAYEKIEPLLVPRITVDELKGRGNTEIVSLVLQLNTLVAEDYAPEVKKMLGPFGEVTQLTKSNQLILQDSVKNLRNILKTTEEVEKKEGGHDTFAHTCVYIKARDAERTLIAQMGDPKLLIIQQMQQLQPRIDPRSGQPIVPAGPAPKIRMFYVSADERTNSILVTGPPDKTSQAREIMKKIDVPNQPGQKDPQLQRFPVPDGTAADIATMLKEQVFRGSTTVQVRNIGTNMIMVYAPPADLMEIAGIIENSGSASANVVKLLPLNSLDAKDAADTLQKMFPQDPKTLIGPVVEADTTRNAVRAKGSKEQVADIEMALKAIDGPTGSGNTMVISLEHGNGAQMAAILQKALEARGINVNVVAPAAPAPVKPKPATTPEQPPMPPPGSGNGGGETPQISDPQAAKPQQPQQPANPNAKPVTITAIGNKLIINTDDPQTRSFIQDVIRTMTQSGGDGDFEVIKLSNANATDAARVIDEFYNGPKQQAGGSPLDRIRGGGFPGGGFPGGQAPGATPTTTSKVRVVADPGSNSLLVRASPIEMLSIREMVKALEGGEETPAAQKVYRIKLTSANVSEIAYVIESLYHDYLGTGSRSSSVNGFQGFSFPGGGASFSGVGGRGNALLRGTDANGNVRPNPLSIGVDERSNTLLVMSNETLYKQINTLVQELDKEAAGYVKSVKVVQIKGVDPNVVQQAIDMFQGNRSMANNMGRGGMGMGGMGMGMNNGFGGMNGMGMGGRGMGMGGFNGGFGGGFNGGGFNGGGFNGGGFNGGGFNGGGRGGNFGGGMGNFGGGQGNFGGGVGNFGGGPAGGMSPGGPGGGGGRGGRGGGNGPGGGGQRSPDREPGGPDFFEYGVKEDPQPSQLFDPQQSQNQSYVWHGEGRLNGSEEQQQPPAGQPAKPAQPGAPAATPPAAPPANPGLTQPRRPVFVESLPELGIVVISGDNPEDIAAIEAIIEMIQKIAQGSEAKIEIVPLEHADATSAANTLSQVFARINTTPSGNILIPQTGNRPGGPAGVLPGGNAQQGSVSSATAANAVFIPLPRLNAILVAAQESRLPFINSEIKKLDIPNAPAGGATPFPLKKASAAQVATLLTQFYAQRYPGEATAQNQVRITYDTSTNTVFVQAGPADMDEIRALIERIDNTVSSAVNDLRIVRLQNAVADELANTIIAAITAGVAAPGATAAPGIVPTAAAAAAARPATTTTTTGGGGLTTRTTSLRFYSGRPGPGGVVEAGVLEDVHITSDLRSNALVISAPEKSMQLILALIRDLDVPAAAQANINIFTLRKADAVQTATLIQQLFTGGGGTTTGGAAGTTLATFAPGATAAPIGGLARPLLNLAGADVSPGAPFVDLRVTVDNRTNSIIVAGAQSDLTVIEAIIARLEDANVQSRQSQVYRLRNQAAADIATALQTFITNALAVQTKANQVTAFQELQRDVVIVPEPISNTLLISATPQIFAELYRLIEQMDQMPPQVVIQVLVAQVALNDDQEFGVEFGLQSPVLFNRSLFTGSGAPTSTASPNIGAPGFNFNTTANSVLPLGNSTNIGQNVVGVQGLGNLNVGRVSPNGNAGGFVFSAQSQSFSLLIRALKTQGLLRVLSSPQVTTLDSQTAAVSIGQDIPIVSGTTVTATGVISNTIDRRDVGVLLRVTPRITPEGKVLMRVFPEVSSVVPQPVDLGNGEISTAFNIQQVETSVVAQDGETVVIGGMIQLTDQQLETKIPCLGDLPYVGAAFRYRTQVRQKNELLVILTPRVVRSQLDMDRVFAEEAKRIKWLMSDVNQIYGPADLHKIIPGAQLPPNLPPIQVNPALVDPNAAPGMPGCAPGMSGGVPGMPGMPGGGWPTSPQIPYGPLVPLFAGDPSVPPAQTGTPPAPPAAGPATLPAPTPTPANPPIDQQQQTGGPTLAPAAYVAPGQPDQPAPAQPPQGKEPSKWKLFHLG